MHRIGHALTIAAIFAVLGIWALIAVSMPSTNVSNPLLIQVIWILLILLTCGYLYVGSNWARLIVGVGLLLIGGLWFMWGIGPFLERPTFFRIVYFGVVLIALGSGFALLVMRQVKDFLAVQRANRSRSVQRIFRVLWLVLALCVAIGLVQDIAKLTYG